MSTFNTGGFLFTKTGANIVLLGTGSSVGSAVTDSGQHNPIFVVPQHVNYNYITYKIIGIKAYAFAQQNWLLELTIPRSILSIEEGAFWQCAELRKVTFLHGSSIQHFPLKIFDSTKLTSLDIPESVMTFSTNALFSNLQLNNITYCGNGSVPGGVIGGPLLPSNIYVTPQYPYGKFSNIDVTVRTDYICPEIITIYQDGPSCTTIYHNVYYYSMLVMIYVIIPK